MKKVAFYGRYSSANQTEQSIEGQLHVCEQYAAANDLQIVRQYIDRAQSGKTAKRREFQRMITDSESGLFEGILVPNPYPAQTYVRFGLASDCRLKQCITRCTLPFSSGRRNETGRSFHVASCVFVSRYTPPCNFAK